MKKRKYNSGERKQRRNLKKVLIFVMLFMLPLLAGAGSTQVQAAKRTGFQVVNGKKYYYDKNGTIHKGWLTVDGKKYYFRKSNGVMVEGWMRLKSGTFYLRRGSGILYTGWEKDAQGNVLRYFDKTTGKMAVGFFKYKNQPYRYFDPQTGLMYSGWLKDSNGDRYYFTKKKGYMATGWVDNSAGQRRYFDPKSGKMVTGWFKNAQKQLYYLDPNTGYLARGIKKIGSKTYAFDPKTGAKLAGQWVVYEGEEYYADEKGLVTTGKHNIDGLSRFFGTDGKLQYSGKQFTIYSDCALLMDADTGEIIFEKRGSVPHANASTTKIMTCILAIENCKFKDKVTVSEYAASQEPTKLYMDEGDSFYVIDLLHSLMIPSHNDTAVALAEHISGTEQKFVKLMNKKAAALGCTNTHFATPNGLDAGFNHYTTARDLAKIARYAMKYKTFRNIVKKTTYSFKSLKGREYTVYTTDRLLSQLPGTIGIKTGYTNKAGHCFVGAAKGKNGHTYISVILGGKTSDMRWEDTERLLRYAMQQ